MLSCATFSSFLFLVMSSLIVDFYWPKVFTTAAVIPDGLAANVKNGEASRSLLDSTKLAIPNVKINDDPFLDEMKGSDSENMNESSNRRLKRRKDYYATTTEHYHYDYRENTFPVYLEEYEYYDSDEYYNYNNFFSHSYTNQYY